MGCRKEKGCTKQSDLIMLRPVFTNMLAEMLLAEKHVNLVSPHGRGRRQTLVDLETLLGDVLVRKIDLKREQDKWESWLKNTLTLDIQVIVIIHNIEHIISNQEVSLQALCKQKNITCLCILEKPCQQQYTWSAQELYLPLEVENRGGL